MSQENSQGERAPQGCRAREVGVEPRSRCVRGYLLLSPHPFARKVRSALFQHGLGREVLGNTPGAMTRSEPSRDAERGEGPGVRSKEAKVPRSYLGYCDHRRSWVDEKGRSLRGGHPPLGGERRREE